MSDYERLCELIDDELAEQIALQTGCEYTRMDETGCASVNGYIVVSQLAYKIVKEYTRV